MIIIHSLPILKQFDEVANAIENSNDDNNVELVKPKIQIYFDDI